MVVLYGGSPTRTAVTRALEIDSTVGEAHFSLAQILFEDDC